MESLLILITPGFFSLLRWVILSAVRDCSHAINNLRCSYTVMHLTLSYYCVHWQFFCFLFFVLVSPNMSHKTNVKTFQGSSQSCFSSLLWRKGQWVRGVGVYQPAQEECRLTGGCNLRRDDLFKMWFCTWLFWHMPAGRQRGIFSSGFGQLGPEMLHY